MVGPAFIGRRKAGALRGDHYSQRLPAHARAPRFDNPRRLALWLRHGDTKIHDDGADNDDGDDDNDGGDVDVSGGDGGGGSTLAVLATARLVFQPHLAGHLARDLRSAGLSATGALVELLLRDDRGWWLIRRAGNEGWEDETERGEELALRNADNVTVGEHDISVGTAGVARRGWRKGRKRRKERRCLWVHMAALSDISEPLVPPPRALLTFDRHAARAELDPDLYGPQKSMTQLAVALRLTHQCNSAGSNNSHTGPVEAVGSLGVGYTASSSESTPSSDADMGALPVKLGCVALTVTQQSVWRDVEKRLISRNQAWWSPHRQALDSDPNQSTGPCRARAFERLVEECRTAQNPSVLVATNGGSHCRGGLTPLQVAIHSGDLIRALALLRAGVPISAKSTPSKERGRRASLITENEDDLGALGLAGVGKSSFKEPSSRFRESYRANRTRADAFGTLSQVTYPPPNMEPLLHTFDTRWGRPEDIPALVLPVPIHAGDTVWQDRVLVRLCEEFGGQTADLNDDPALPGLRCAGSSVRFRVLTADRKVSTSRVLRASGNRRSAEEPDDEEHASFLLQVPPGVLATVLQSLDPPDLLSLERVCRLLRVLCTDPAVGGLGWRAMIKRFSISGSSVPLPGSDEKALLRLSTQQLKLHFFRHCQTPGLPHTRVLWRDGIDVWNHPQTFMRTAVIADVLLSCQHAARGDEMNESVPLHFKQEVLKCLVIPRTHTAAALRYTWSLGFSPQVVALGACPAHSTDGDANEYFLPADDNIVRPFPHEHTCYHGLTLFERLAAAGRGLRQQPQMGGSLGSSVPAAYGLVIRDERGLAMVSRFWDLACPESKAESMAGSMALSNLSQDDRFCTVRVKMFPSQAIVDVAIPLLSFSASGAGIDGVRRKRVRNLVRAQVVRVSVPVAEILEDFACCDASGANFDAESDAHSDAGGRGTVSLVRRKLPPGTKLECGEVNRTSTRTPLGQQYRFNSDPEKVVVASVFGEALALVTMTQVNSGSTGVEPRFRIDGIVLEQELDVMDVLPVELSPCHVLLGVRARDEDGGAFALFMTAKLPA